MSQDDHPSSQHALDVGSSLYRKPKQKMSQDGHLSSRHALDVGFSSGGASGSKSSALVRTGKEDEVPLSRPIDMISAVKEFHVLSKEDLSKLIKDGKNGNIQWTKADGTSFEINVEDMARKLSIHLIGYYVESKQDEALFKYLLAGVRLLHTLCDLAPSHRRLKEILFEETEALRQTAYLVSSMIYFLHNTEEKIDASNDMVHLHSALLASTLYLFKSIVHEQWKCNNHALLLDFLPEIHVLTSLAFQTVGSIIKFLQVKLVSMQSSDDEVYHLFQLFEASLQFLYTLSQEEIFRKRAIYQNKVLCKGGVVLKLVQDIMKLLECEDSYLNACIYRLKTKALYIMLYLFEAANSSFMKSSISMTQGLDIAKSTLSEVLEVLKKMFCGGFKDHPRGTVQLNAMRIAEIFTDDINFQFYVALNLTESLTRVFSQPHKEFLHNWCSSELDPIEEDVHLEFDSVAAAGEILGVIPRLDVSKSTYSTSRALQTPYAHQKSSLLIKIIAHLTCFKSNTPPGEKGLLINKFFQSLQMEHPNLPNGGARSSGERAAVTMKNLHSFLAHTGSLVPEYNLQVDVNHLSLFIKKLEALLAPQDSRSRLVKEVLDTSECPLHSPMVKTHRLFFSEDVENQYEDVVTEDHTENQFNGSRKDDQHNGTLVTIPQQDGSSMGIRNSFGRMETAEVDPQEETVRSRHSDEKQKKKRKGGIMNDLQIAMIENDLKDDPDMRSNAGIRELWAAKLSSLGSEIITSKQLINWLDYHKPKRARAAAKAPATLKICGRESSKTVTDVFLRSSFKHEPGQRVMLIDDKGQEIGQGSIHLTKERWFKRNLEELKLCVVDVNDLKVAKNTKLPHPCDGTGTSFAEAEMIQSKMRVLWDSSKLLLIQQQA